MLCVSHRTSGIVLEAGPDYRGAAQRGVDASCIELQRLTGVSAISIDPIGGVIC